VTDTTTGLLWQKAYQQTLSQPMAIAYCQGLSLAGHCDWRLPTRIELGTLVDYTKSAGPMIDTTFQSSANGFWTASPVAASPSTNAWLVNFSVGLVESDIMVSALYDARCVR
jgi:hypothetical protein